MKRNVSITGIVISVILYSGIMNTLSAQQSPEPSEAQDTSTAPNGIPYNTGKIYLQNFFCMPWEPAPGGYETESLYSDSSSAYPPGTGKPIGIAWQNSALSNRNGWSSFTKYSRTSVALGTASSVAIWGTIAAQSYRERNNLNFYTASAAAALSAYQGFKLWKLVTGNDDD